MRYYHNTISEILLFLLSFMYSVSFVLIVISKMAQWNASDSGILRKTQVVENHNELLVFGYACKLFRDDEKALYIDQGKHLIPWMGDDKLKIDRLVLQM